MNGYNNAKLLRRVGVAADAACDERPLLSQPEWEEADIVGDYDAMQPLGPQVRAVGWHRPEWVLPLREPFADRRFRGEYRLKYSARLAARWLRLRRLYAELRAEYGMLSSPNGELRFADVRTADHAVWMHGLWIGSLPKLFRQYDLVQAYATHAILALVAAPDRPYVAYEHGTMRDMPFEDSWQGRLLSLAYRRASAVIITNADVVAAANRLGLQNHVFVPHPLDETKYTPGSSELGATLRADGAGPILFAPARHDWDVKGTDVFLRAFAELVHRDEPRAVLVLTTWGEEVERSRQLIRELAIERNVRWFPPLPKRRLIDAYRAADVVLDQFVIGTFGGIAPEAMACGRPVVMAFDHDLHRWCFSELPPIVAARGANEIYAQLRRLTADRAERERLGRAGRDWIERHHGWRLVVDRQLRIYEKIRERHRCETTSWTRAQRSRTPA